MVSPDASNDVVADKPQLLDLKALQAELGDGPMRFAPHGERTLQEQLDELGGDELKCFQTLKEKWHASHPDQPLSDEMCLRFARCSPGVKKFNSKASAKVMKKFDRRYLTLTAASMEDQLLSMTLFPVPGLKTSEGHDCFYMRPSRYFPKQTATEQIIDNLAYCMGVMTEKEKACTEGIGFVAYMNDWHMENFSVSYCYQFMMMLQGRVPVRVRQFLIVNPPGWFGKIWNIMKPMLAADFRKKVCMIPESALSQYLEAGYEKYLSDDMHSGTVDTSQMVKDFVTYRKRVESCL